MDSLLFAVAASLVLAFVGGITTLPHSRCRIRR